jgi:hypothetical protein
MNLEDAAKDHSLMAAALDHSHRHWHDFVASNELERWGEPAALLAERRYRDFVGPDGTAWAVFLVTDPVCLVSNIPNTYARTFAQGLPLDWEPVPADAAVSVETALAWTAANVGSAGALPSPGRHRLGSEIDPNRENAPDDWLYKRTQYPQRAVTIAIPESPAVEAVATWLEQARTELIVPIVTSLADRVSTEVHSDREMELRPYALDLSAFTSTPAGRSTQRPGDDATWAKVLTLLRTGKSPDASVGIFERNGVGTGTFYRRGVHIDFRSDPTWEFPRAMLLSASACTALAADAGLNLDAALDTLRRSAQTLFPNAMHS